MILITKNEILISELSLLDRKSHNLIFAGYFNEQKTNFNIHDYIHD